MAELLRDFDGRPIQVVGNLDNVTSLNPKGLDHAGYERGRVGRAARESIDFLEQSRARRAIFCPQDGMEKSRGQALLAPYAQRIDETNDPALESYLVAKLKEALDAFEGRRPLPEALPDAAPERWAQRQDKSESVPAFIQRVWKPWLDAGLLTQADLRRLDGGLRFELFAYCKLTNQKASDFIPPKWKRGDPKSASRINRLNKEAAQSEPS